jgi:hypothetical protein
MSKVSGDAFNDAYNGSTGSDGEVRGSDKDTDWHKTGDTWFRDKGDGNEYMSKSDSANGRNRDHIHLHPKDSQGNRTHTVTKEHTASEGRKYGAKEAYNSPGDTLFNGVKNFLGL